MFAPYNDVPRELVDQYMKEVRDPHPFLSFAGPRLLPEGMTTIEAIKHAIKTGTPLPPPPDYIPGAVY